MKSMHGPLLACIVVGSLALPQQARAQDASGTIQKIRDTGAIALGVRDSSLPFPISTVSTITPATPSISACGSWKR